MSIFVELSLIIVLAAGVAGVMRLLKQPLIMGHIITGLLVGPHILGISHSVETLETFSQFGISILLFIVGLGLSPRVIKQVGKVAIITGIGQILFTTGIGLLIGLALGYSMVSALFIAIALTFSSTIIILKLLSDRHDLEKLHGKIAIGFLLVQDLVATIILIVVATSAAGGNAKTTLLFTILKGIALTITISFISIKMLPKLENFVAKSQEFLFLFSMAWGLGLAALFQQIGFSIEIGALIAGVTLALSPYAEETAARLKPLRDFFIIMFFVLLGTKMDLALFGDIFGQALIFSLFVLIGNPLIVVILMGALKYNKKTGFKAGLTVAQISEFSLILILLALQLGYVDEKVLSLTTLVGLITIAGSTYLIIYEDKIYPRIAKYLSFFERKQPIETTDILGSYEVVLFGANRIGWDFLTLFRRLGQSFLAVDFDPEKVKSLTAEGINCRYGDADDPEFLNELGIENSKMIVSTIPDYETNMFLVKQVKKANEESIVILINYDLDQTLELYKAGADYVILPHFIGGHFTAQMAAKHWFNIDRFRAEREKHIKYLEERRRLGHKHPTRL